MYCWLQCFSFTNTHIHNAVTPLCWHPDLRVSDSNTSAEHHQLSSKLKAYSSLSAKLAVEHFPHGHISNRPAVCVGGSLGNQRSRLDFCCALTEDLSLLLDCSTLCNAIKARHVTFSFPQ